MKSNTKEIERWSAKWIAARSPFVFYRQFPKKLRNHINANCMTLTTVTPPASITVSIYAAALYSAMLFELNHHQNSYYSDYTHCWAVKMSNIFACNWNSIIYFSMVLMPLVCVNLLVIAFWVFPDFHPLRPKWLQSKTSNGIRTMRNEKPLTEFFFIHHQPEICIFFLFFLLQCCQVEQFVRIFLPRFFRFLFDSPCQISNVTSLTEAFDTHSDLRQCTRYSIHLSIYKINTLQRLCAYMCVSTPNSIIVCATIQRSHSTV